MDHSIGEEMTFVYKSNEIQTGEIIEFAGVVKRIALNLRMKMSGLLFLIVILL